MLDHDDFVHLDILPGIRHRVEIEKPVLQLRGLRYHRGNGIPGHNQYRNDCRMTVGLMPVTGLPLPFMSYGGSSLVFFWAAIGFLLAVNRDWQEY
jgi:hypothetical protein